MSIPAATAKHRHAMPGMSRSSLWLCGPCSFASSRPTVTVRPRARRNSARQGAFELNLRVYQPVPPAPLQKRTLARLRLELPPLCTAFLSPCNQGQLQAAASTSLSLFVKFLHCSGEVPVASGRRAVTVAILSAAQGSFRTPTSCAKFT